MKARGEGVLPSPSIANFFTPSNTLPFLLDCDFVLWTAKSPYTFEFVWLHSAE